MTESRLLFHFIIPATPTAKGRARSRIIKGKHGKNAGKTFVSHYTPATTRDYEQLVADAAKATMGGRNVLTCPVDLLVEFRFAIPPSWPKWKKELAAVNLVHHTKKPDGSNLVKAIEDACNTVLFRDDGQVVGCVTDKLYTAGAECIDVYGFRRTGISCDGTRAEAEAELAGFDPSIRMDNWPIGRRLRRLKLVSP